MIAVGRRDTIVSSVLRGPGRSPDRAARGYPIAAGTEAQHTHAFAAFASCRPHRPDSHHSTKEPQ